MCSKKDYQNFVDAYNNLLPDAQDKFLDMWKNRSQYTVNDFANGMRAGTYTMYKNSEVDLKLPTVKTEKANKSNSERPIEVNLNIDKFVNETAQSVDELINEIAFQLKRKALF